MPIDKALDYAQERDLDLVEVAAEAKPPVCRVLDYSKYKYEQEQKAKAARKHQKQVNVREIKLRPKIADNDYETKKNHVVRFLTGEDRVKVTIMFRGREQSHPERGTALLMRLAEDVAELGTIEQRPIQDGRNMTMLLSPGAQEAGPRPRDGRREARAAPPPRPRAATEAQAKPAEEAEAPRSAGPEPAAEADAAAKPPSTPPRRAPLGRLLQYGSHAEDEVPFRREEALPQDRQGQAPGASRDDQPHPREEERQAQAAAGAAGRGGKGRREARQEAARVMARVKRSVHARKKRRATLDRAKGYRGQSSKSYKRAKEALLKADTYAYRDRRNKKRDFRRLWITRINAAARQEGMTYGTFMHGLKLAGVELDRKVLADIAVRDPETFRRFAETAREAAAA